MNQKVNKGVPIFHEGETGDCAYIIEKGSVELSILINGTQKKIGTLQEGAIFGEMALIGNRLRTGTAIACEETWLIVIPEKYFEEKLESSDKFIHLLLKLILRRYIEMRTRLDNILTKSRCDSSLIIDDESMPDCKGNTVDTARQLEAENNLKYAFEDGQLELFYQPIVTLANLKVSGCESLIRWRHPKHGLVPPVEFIGLAEESGLIIPIGLWIITEATKACQRLLSHNDDFSFVSINLSGKQFNTGDLVQNIERIFQEQNIQAENIKFEITESILMANPLDIAASLQALKKNGSTIAIDDFGTGYSSFSYLHRFPIDTLKIDKSFVSTMLDNSKSYEIVKSLCVLAKAIGMSIVAEGIETAEEHRLLTEMGVDYGQGYFYAKPMPEAEFCNYLQEH
ncbi:MAG: EAL domain-containing protein [Methylobacter sp.]|nr:EAL domain-containing protein [Methylobacter sp.]